MPKFMDIHDNMKGVTAEALRAEHKKDLEAMDPSLHRRGDVRRHMMRRESAQE